MRITIKNKIGPESLESLLKLVAITLGLVATLSGCAAVGPAFSPVRDMERGLGVLYIYRPEAHAMSILSAVFDIDERQVTALENNGYAAIPISVGQHKIGHHWKAGIVGNSKLEGKPIVATVNITAGQATYVRLLSRARSKVVDAAYPNIGINTHFQWALEEVGEGVALPELQQTKGSPVELRP